MSALDRLVWPGPQ